MNDEPVIVTKRAIDVTPQRHGVWCSICGGEPFVNPIVNRRWSDDGERITFMLDSFNFDFRLPYEDMDVVEIEPSRYCDMDMVMRNDAVFMSKRPMSDIEYARWWAE